jgi:uncharacterized protein
MQYSAGMVIDHLWSAHMPAPADAPPWLAGAHNDFARRMLDLERPFPCHFGVQGQLAGQTWFSAVDRDDPEWSIDTLAGALATYRELAWQGPKRQSLVVFVGPPEHAPDLGRDTARFWGVLDRLSALDVAGWPPGQPRDVLDPAWQWCFDGEPWFVFGCSAAYTRRRSRNVGPCLALVFQVRRVFDGLSGSSIAGRAAKQRVRAALDHYDDIPVHPHLGDPMHSSTFKWRQYMIPDDQAILDERSCPFGLSDGTGPAPS